MKKTFVIAAVAAFAASLAEGAMPVTHREATNIVKAVAYAKDEADGRYLTANLAGKTVVTGTDTVLKMGAGTLIDGTDGMCIRLAGGTTLHLPAAPEGAGTATLATLDDVAKAVSHEEDVRVHDYGVLSDRSLATGFQIPASLLSRAGYLRNVVVTGASNDSGVWDKDTPVWIECCGVDAAFAETRIAKSAPVSAFRIGVENAFAFGDVKLGGYGIYRFRFMKGASPPGEPAKVRVALGTGYDPAAGYGVFLPGERLEWIAKARFTCLVR